MSIQSYLPNSENPKKNSEPLTENNFENMVYDEANVPYHVTVDDKDNRPPDHLSHKPVYYTDLTESEGESSDAKFLSVGLAQYNRNSLSVKIFRHSGKRWSRQSEEIPMERFIRMSVFAVKVIMETIKSIKQETPLKNTIQLNNSTKSINKHTIKKMELTKETEDLFCHLFNSKINENIQQDLKQLKSQLDEMAGAGLLDINTDERKAGLFHGTLEPGFFEELSEQELSDWE